ncbi:MAG: hypothetical protein DRQ47_08005 [Gammaproteobacteria bacterium]|nr:MAG: hypothetical protein DRQ47_08005 [Gammaproteobacteria bacterium]
MEINTAKEFAENLGLRTNMICLAVVPGKYYDLYRVPVTRSRNIPQKAQTRFPYVLEKQGINQMKCEIGLPKELWNDVVLIECIDLVWGGDCKNLFAKVLKYM